MGVQSHALTHQCMQASAPHTQPAINRRGLGAQVSSNDLPLLTIASLPTIESLDSLLRDCPAQGYPHIGMDTRTSTRQRTTATHRNHSIQHHNITTSQHTTSQR
jgi:hypothetical protein